MESCPGRPLQYNFGFQQQHGATGSRASLEEERVPHPQQQHGGATHSRASFEGTPPTEPLAAELLLRTMVERSYLDRGNPSVDKGSPSTPATLRHSQQSFSWGQSAGTLSLERSVNQHYLNLPRGRQNQFAKRLKIGHCRQTYLASVGRRSSSSLS